MRKIQQLTDIEIAQKYINKVRNAKEKGHAFILTLADFSRLMKRKTCYYTGIYLQNKYLTNADGRTLDRIDSTKGYTKENTVTCCYLFNQLKATTENPTLNITNKHLKRGINKL